jgi:endonuclease III
MDDYYIDLKCALAAASQEEQWERCSMLVELMLSARNWDEETRTSMERKLATYRRLAVGS